MKYPDRKRISCKIGTVPSIVWVHGKDRIEVGAHIRYRFYLGGSKEWNLRCGRWETALVTEVQHDGYFKAYRF